MSTITSTLNTHELPTLTERRHCPLCRKFKRLMKIFTKTNIGKVKLQASRNFSFYFYPANIFKRSNIATFASEIKRFVIASSSSFFHYFSGVTWNSEQKIFYRSSSSYYNLVICCYKITFFWSIPFVNNYGSFCKHLWLMAMKMRLEVKSGSQRYCTIRPSPKHGPKNTKYEMCLNTMMTIVLSKG